MTGTVIEELFIRLGLQSTVAADANEAEQQVSSMADTVVKHSKKIGAGMTAAGLAIVGLTDSAKKTNAALGVTGLQLGKTSDEMRDLALETTNITFPLDDVVDTFDLLTRAGMRNADQIAATGNAFSDLGTALGYPASEMADTLIPAFNAFGIPLEDASDHVDTFTHLVRNTTVDLSDYASMVNYLAPHLDTMNLSVEESVAVMEALADKGIQGSAATRQFRSAATQAEGDVSAFYAALGLTADEVATYTAEIKGADGITREFAEAQEAQFGMVDHLKQAWDEWSFAIGSALEPLDGVGAALTVLGPIVAGIGPIMTGVSAIQTSALVPSLMATAAAGWAAIAPWAPFILAGAAVVAALWLLEEHFGLVSGAIDFLFGIGTGLVDWLVGAFTGGLDDGSDALLLFLGPIGAVVYAFQHWDEILPAIQGVFESIIDYVTGLFDWFAEAGSNIVGAIVDGILSSPVTPWGAMTTVLGAVGDLLPHSPAKEGPLSEEPNWGAYLVDPLVEAAARMPAALSDGLEVATVQPLPAATRGNATTSIGGDTLHIGQINVRNDQDLGEIFRRWEELQRSKRVQRGVRA